MAETHSKLLICGGRVIDPYSRIDGPRDVFIENGNVAAVLMPESDEVKTLLASGGVVVEDATGHWVLPGFFDLHVHFREPGQEHKETLESGSRAAVAGGFTSVVCMANTRPVNDSREVTRFVLDQSKKTAVCKVHTIGAVTVGLKGQVLADFEGMFEEGAIGLSDDGMPVANSQLMREALEFCRSADSLVMSHAEDHSLVNGGVMHEGARSRFLKQRGNPAASEEIMIAREIALARLTKGHVHIQHVSSEIGLRMIERAKKDGVSISCEVTPHHLFLTCDSVDGQNTSFKMAPPLREETDRQALVEGFCSGLIDVIATDHAPHSHLEKEKSFDEAAFGVIGLEAAAAKTFELVLSGKCSAMNWVSALSTTPERLMLHRATGIEKGSAADLVIFDPDEKWILTEAQVFSKSQNSPFLNTHLRGRVKSTWVNGNCVFRANSVQ